MRLGLTFFLVTLLLGCAPDRPPYGRWNEADIENVRHLVIAWEAENQSNKIANTLSESMPTIITDEEMAPVIAHLEKALDEARLVRDEVLAKAHPELPDHCNNEFERGLGSGPIKGILKRPRV